MNVTIRLWHIHHSTVNIEHPTFWFRSNRAGNELRIALDADSAVLTDGRAPNM
jgi:hypothetical protein